MAGPRISTDTADRIVTSLPRLSRLADRILGFFEHVGRMALLTWSAFRALPEAMRSRRLILDQMVRMGTDSMPLVTIVSVFTGAVAAWQAAYQLRGWAPISWLSA